MPYKTFFTAALVFLKAKRLVSPNFPVTFSPFFGNPMAAVESKGNVVIASFMAVWHW
jgi:hypothetical protein